MALATPKELDQVYDDAQLTWLRKRFFLYAWLSIFFLGLSLVGSVLLLVTYAIEGPLEEGTPFAMSAVFWGSEAFSALLPMLAFIFGVRWVKRHVPDRRQVIKMIYWLFVCTHLLAMEHLLLTGFLYAPGSASGLNHYLSQGELFISHLFAAIIIPWTVRESIRPLLPLLALHVVHIALFTDDPVTHRLGDLLLLSLVGLPGVVVCWFKQRRFRRDFHYRTYRDVYQYVSREVEQARALHESFFPKRVTHGPLRLDYYYQPMSQLGGDYLHAHVWEDDDGQPESILCAVIDVTGHGLPATLTANHLHALLKRQVQQHQRPDPGELLADLNRYMHESFSGLSVFATAIIMRLDRDAERVVWASAGHPPAFLVSEGRCEPVLESTACLLGVLEPDSFVSESREIQMSQNVSIVAYTDGASELPLKGGDMLGINGFADRVAALSASGRLGCKQLMQDLAGLTTGERQDDVLLVCLSLGPVESSAALEADLAEASLTEPGHAAATARVV